MSSTEPTLVRCPSCDQGSPSIKCYRVMDYHFYLIASMWTSRQIAGCPRCIRGDIGRFAAKNLVTAHLLWPLLIGPWALGLWLASLTPGHSRAVRKLLR